MEHVAVGGHPRRLHLQSYGARAVHLPGRGAGVDERPPHLHVQHHPPRVEVLAHAQGALPAPHSREHPDDADRALALHLMALAFHGLVEPDGLFVAPPQLRARLDQRVVRDGVGLDPLLLHLAEGAEGPVRVDPGERVDQRVVHVHVGPDAFPLELLEQRDHLARAAAPRGCAHGGAVRPAVHLQPRLLERVEHRERVVHLAALAELVDGHGVVVRVGRKDVGEHANRVGRLPLVAYLLDEHLRPHQGAHLLHPNLV
mmetsp:Transcript_65307/g.206292  ORF Transcript_65307/g.206292 Transcript_65307/m.206292 type:complete len:257 (+) Transcript_65307:2021-2791(+)